MQVDMQLSSTKFVVSSVAVFTFYYSVRID